MRFGLVRVIRKRLAQLHNFSKYFDIPKWNVCINLNISALETAVG